MCPKVSNAVYGAKAAQLFARPLEYNLFHCMAWTEQQILSDASCNRGGPNAVFVTLARPLQVRFQQNGHPSTATLRTFGIANETKRSILYIPVNAFARPPLPPGTSPYRGPALYGLFGVDGDPFDLASGECLTA